ncbi:MAG: hypothetical protein ACRD9Q_05370, partial [Nitrososphaeraceae archaeon]
MNKLKNKIEQLKEAAVGVDFNESKEPESSFERRQKIHKTINNTMRFNKAPLRKEVPFAPIINQKENEESAVGLTTAINEYISKGIKPRPKFRAKDRKSIVSAKMQTMFGGPHRFVKGNIPSFDEVKARFNSPGTFWFPHKNYEPGFSHDVTDRFLDLNGFSDVGVANIRSKFGDKINPLHAISRTQVEGEQLTEAHRKPYNDIIREGKVPIIGGYTMKNKKRVTDVGTIESMTDEEATKRMGTEQESSFRLHPLKGLGEFFYNKNYKIKTAQDEPLKTVQPLSIIFRGKRHVHMGKLDVGNLKYDETNPMKDVNIISLNMVNLSTNEIH